MPGPAATMDGPAPLTATEIPTPLRFTPRLVATATPRTQRLKRIDMIRIDAAHGTLRDMAEVRESYDCPVILDIPGAESTRRTSVLTTSELLVFAAAEHFDWIGLRGVEDCEYVGMARDFLDPTIKIAATVSHPQVFKQNLGPICDTVDAIILGYAELQRAVGPRVVRDYIRHAIDEAAEYGKPCLLGTGVLPSMMETRTPGAKDLRQVSHYLRDGCGGFVLCEETVAGVDPQACIDTLQLAVGLANSYSPAAVGSATLSGDPVLVDPS